MFSKPFVLGCQYLGEDLPMSVQCVLERLVLVLHDGGEQGLLPISPPLQRSPGCSQWQADILVTNCCPSCLCPQLSHELEQRWSGCEEGLRLRRVLPGWEEGGAPAAAKVSHVFRCDGVGGRLRQEPAAAVILQNRHQKSQFR